MIHQFQAISALAGSGKTHQLTTRFIGLLSLGAAPETILAITFTRKAAGEVFDRVVRRLAAAVLSEQGRLQLQQDLRAFHVDEHFALDPAAPGAWLRTLLDAMPSLHIGTIDSLFVNILRAYAVEMGLPPRQEILDGGALDVAHETALQAALETARREHAAHQGFLEAFKLATHAEEKNVRRVMLDLAHSIHQLYLQFPAPEAWGNRARMWPVPTWWDAAAGIPREEILDRLDAFQQRIEERASDRQYLKGWLGVLDKLRCGDFSEALKSTLLQNLVAQLDALGQGAVELSYGRKKYLLPRADAAEVRLFLAYALHTTITEGLQETRGCHRLMRTYEETYQSVVRAQGRLSFADIQFVLDQARLSGIKMEIDYRLDGKFDHWMLDEFQDTSLRQWAVIANLADEILQSAEGGRSFFYVGDVKQAIYGWRGGDSTLFEAVQHYYRPLFGEQPSILNTSWRSSPVVLRAVNTAFGAALEGPLAGFPAVTARWRRNWQDHLCAEQNRALPGRVELYALEDPPAGTATPAIEMACRIVANLKAQRVESIAVLVRTNACGDEVADALRARGLDVRREINPQLADNGAISALLSLLAFSEHPGDDFSWRHIRFAGLLDALNRWAAPEMAADETQLRAHLADRVRQTAMAKGIAGLLEEIIAHCRDYLPMNDFVDIRLRQLINAAQEFDRQAQGGPADFTAQACRCEVKDPVHASGVVVMTIHKAKGLEFDAVVLPDLQGPRRQINHLESGILCPGQTAAAAGEDLHAEPGAESWIFPLPSEPLAQLDAVLSTFRARAENNKVYEELCLLYVALTRARQGLYLVTMEPKKSGQSVFPATLLQQTLGMAGTMRVYEQDEIKGRILYEDGDPDWRPHTPKAPKESGPNLLPLPFEPQALPAGAAIHRLIVSTPSGAEAFPPIKAGSLFDPAGKRGAARGSILHALMQRIEWYEAGLAARLYEAATQEAWDAQLLDEIKAEFFEALAAPAIQAVLAHPGHPADLWREQAFELAEGNHWITGRIDRVVVEKDAAGKPLRATLLDFKSDRILHPDDLARKTEKYRPQMQAYTRAIARLLILPPRHITARLVFLHGKTVMDL